MRVEPNVTETLGRNREYSFRLLRQDWLITTDPHIWRVCPITGTQGLKARSVFTTRLVTKTALGSRIHVDGWSAIRTRCGARRSHPICPSTAHNRDLCRTALLRLAINPSKWFRKQCGVIRYQSPFGWVSGTILELGSSRMPLEGGSF